MAGLFNEATGHTVFDYARRVKAARQTQNSGGSDTWKAGGYEFVPAFTSGFWFSLPVDGFPVIGTGPYSIVFGAAPTSAMLAVNGIFTDNSNFWQFSNGKPALGGSTIGATDWRNTGYHDFAYVRRSTATGGLEGYADGEQIGSITHSSSLASPSALKIGVGDTATRLASGLYQYLYFFKRALTAEEIRILQQDPYCMFREPETPVWWSLGNVYQALANDGFSLGESHAANASILATIQDGITAGESMDQARFLEGLAWDGIQAGESLQKSASYLAAAMDGIQAGENLGQKGLFESLASEGVNLGDGVSVSVSFVGTAQDGLKIGDQAPVCGSFGAQVVDGLSMAEAVAVSSLLSVALQDGFWGSDTPTAPDTVNVMDGVVLSTQAQARLTAQVAVLDGLVGGDGAVTQALHTLLALDGATLSESLEKSRKSIQSLVDGVKAGDATLAKASFSVEVSDGFQMAEAVGAIARLAVLVTDGFKFGDAPRIFEGVGGITITFTAHGVGFEFTVKQPGIEFSVQ